MISIQYASSPTHIVHVMASKLLLVTIFLLPHALQAKVCNVTDYGAKGDGKSNDTDAFNLAFKACASQDDQMNTLLVPKGGVFLVWPLSVHDEECSYLSFSVLGKIIAPEEPATWTNNVSYFHFDKCKNLVITGDNMGVIDGQGDIWWKIRSKDSSIEGPKLIIIDEGENVTVTGITLQNSPMFHLVPENSHNLLIDGLTITAPEQSPNTDGIDPSNSQNIVIRNCHISTGDDNVALKPGTNGVLIENCWFGSGHGCSIGSINDTGVWDVVVRNVTFEKTESGARIKTWQGGSGRVENITYTDLRMIETGLPLDIDMYYCPHSKCKNSTKGESSTPEQLVQF